MRNPQVHAFLDLYLIHRPPGALHKAASHSKIILTRFGWDWSLPHTTVLRELGLLLDVAMLINSSTRPTVSPEFRDNNSDHLVKRPERHPGYYTQTWISGNTFNSLAVPTQPESGGHVVPTITHDPLTLNTYLEVGTTFGGKYWYQKPSLWSNGSCKDSIRDTTRIIVSQLRSHAPKEPCPLVFFESSNNHIQARNTNRPQRGS